MCKCLVNRRKFNHFCCLLNAFVIDASKFDDKNVLNYCDFAFVYISIEI